MPPATASFVISKQEWVGWAVEWAVLGALRKTLMMMTMTMMMVGEATAYYVLLLGLQSKLKVMKATKGLSH